MSVAGDATDGDHGGLVAALEDALDSAIVSLSPVSGGDLNDAFRAETADGGVLFVKTAADAQPGGYAAEARGLAWLAAAGGLPTPRVAAVGDPGAADDTTPPGDAVDVAAAGGSEARGTAAGAGCVTGPAPERPGPGAAGPRFLALEWIEPGRPGTITDEELGRGLARVHLAGAEAHGGPDDVLRLGPLALPNAPAADAATFLLERRLRPLAEAAVRRGALDPAASALVDRLGARLPELLGPHEPPARLHGDLWTGNVLVDRQGHPWLIDPAAHGGHREVDLALLALFGGGGIGGRRFRAAYEDVAPLADGAEDRVALWQLTPLLIHAVLFGGGYGDRVLGVLRRYD